MRALAPALLAGALLGCSLSAGAVDIAAATVQGRRVLVVQDEAPDTENPSGGHIKSGDAKRFQATLQKAMPVDEVLLNSRGGSEPDGLAMGRAIRRAGLSTRIPKGAMCASACADVFMGGVARRVDEGGRYGIHMGTVANDPEFIDKIFIEIIGAYDAKEKQLDRARVRKLIQMFEQASAKAASRWAAYVLEMGGSPRIVDIGSNSEASSMNWLSRPQMIDLNVINVDN